ncbi:hypothetical protein V6N13_065462 [Hibiscus sabdariffa]|uniref:Uncharacterized protein n=1 Tax=Hibiscus sabdariffa TaxID=183260 RepID=A0ABR2QQR8_9ROSI
MEREFSPPPFDDENDYDYDDDDDFLPNLGMDMSEPLTLTKQQYQATYEAVKKLYSKENTSKKPVGAKKPPQPPKKVAGKRIKKSRL